MIFVTLDADKDSTALLFGTQWQAGAGGITPTLLSYSFPGGSSLWPGYAAGSEPRTGYAPLAISDEQEAVRAALAAWSTVAHIEFQQVADDSSGFGLLRIAYTTLGMDTSQLAYSYPPCDNASGGDVWLSAQLRASLYADFAPGSLSAWVLLHELGHALGLKHPHASSPYNTSTLGSLDDSLFNSVMSYYAWPGVALTQTNMDRLPSSPMAFDIDALQTHYGASVARSGDDHYSYDGDGKYLETIVDSAGTDTITVTGRRDAVIDLRPDGWSQLGVPVQINGGSIQSANTVRIHGGTLIENASGADGNDRLIGNAANNELSGGAGNDTLTGGAGNDTLDGGEGVDRALFSARHAAYTLAAVESGYSLVGADGNDTLSNLERLQFLDATLAFDTSGNAGQTYRLYQAAFARTPDLMGLGGWIGGMDGGLTLSQVASSFMASAEFQFLYGTNPSDEQFVSLLYTNALHRTADAGGLAYWVNQLVSNLQSRAEVLMSFSESAENQAAVQAYIANGLLYVSAEQSTAAQGQSFVGTSGADSLIGTVSNDSFTGGADDDNLNGGYGIDSAIYSGSRASYTITNSGANLTVAGGTDGTDTLTNIERIKFDGTALAFDTSGNAGQTYRLYQAAFDRTPDTPGLSDWIRGMDTGLTLAQVASGFIGSAEFQGLYGANPSDQAFVTLLYQNVHNRAPDAGGQAYWLDELGRGLTREMVLIGFSESDGNQAALMGVMQGGIEYVAV